MVIAAYCSTGIVFYLDARPKACQTQHRPQIGLAIKIWGSAGLSDIKPLRIAMKLTVSKFLGIIWSTYQVKSPNSIFQKHPERSESKLKWNTITNTKSQKSGTCKTGSFIRIAVQREPHTCVQRSNQTFQRHRGPTSLSMCLMVSAAGLLVPLMSGFGKVWYMSHWSSRKQITTCFLKLHHNIMFIQKNDHINIHTNGVGTTIIVWKESA